jgi:hypothetical protein
MILEGRLKLFREIFDDWLVKAAGVILVLLIVLVIFNTFSGLPERYPLFGVLEYMMVPILFVAGGIVFILAILKYIKR